MVAAILEKRTSEQVTFDIDCSALLASDETISSVDSITAEPTTDPPLEFGVPTINASEITYPDGHVAPAGQVVQVQITGGTIGNGMPAQTYIIRPLLSTSRNPVVEATCELRVKDKP